MNPIENLKNFVTTNSPVNVAIVFGLVLFFATVIVVAIVAVFRQLGVDSAHGGMTIKEKPKKKKKPVEKPKTDDAEKAVDGTFAIEKTPDEDKKLKKKKNKKKKGDSGEAIPQGTNQPAANALYPVQPIIIQCSNCGAQHAPVQQMPMQPAAPQHQQIITQTRVVEKLVPQTNAKTPAPRSKVKVRVVNLKKADKYLLLSTGIFCVGLGAMIQRTLSNNK